MPELTGRISRLSGLIKALAALLALLPGVAIMLGLVDIPPSLVDLIKYISFSISIVVLIAIMLMSRFIGKMSNGAAVALIVASAIGGAALATSYFMFANSHVIAIPNGEEVDRYIIPLEPSPAIHALIDPFAGDYAEALETSVQKLRLQQLMERESGGSTAIMILLLVLAQTLIITAIVVGAWKLSGLDMPGAGKRRQRKAPA